MSAPESATALFVDTGGFFAQAYPGDTGDRHERARAVFDAIRSGDLPYRPLYTSAFVLAELATLLARKAGHDAAVEGLGRVTGSPNVRVVYPDEEIVAATERQFVRYDDAGITFVDHSSAVIADVHDVDHVFTFDTDDFHALGLRCVPADIEVP